MGVVILVPSAEIVYMYVSFHFHAYLISKSFIDRVFVTRTFKISCQLKTLVENVDVDHIMPVMKTLQRAAGNYVVIFAWEIVTKPINE